MKRSPPPIKQPFNAAAARPKLKPSFNSAARAPTKPKVTHPQPTLKPPGMRGPGPTIAPPKPQTVPTRKSPPAPKVAFAKAAAQKQGLRNSGQQKTRTQSPKQPVGLTRTFNQAVKR